VDTTTDVVVVGGGVIGAACAWRLAGAGADVMVVDPQPGRAASHAAAGMLAPVTEAHYGEERLVGLTLAAAAAYPDFVAELAAANGADVGYRTCGTLSVAFDAGDRAALADLVAFQRRLGLEVSVLSGREAREAEPLLAPGVSGAALAGGDHQVDPRRLTTALLDAAQRAGAGVQAERVGELLIGPAGVRGVRLASGSLLAARHVVLAAGAWSARLAPPGLCPVRPVKGQILRLAAPAGLPGLRHTVRAMVGGGACYVLARESGEVVVGATVEEMGFDTSVLAGPVYTLLRDATACLPWLAECRFVEAFAGLRPGTPDNAPLVGPAGPDGLVLATGHYRNGVLMAPVTAAAVTAAVTGTGDEVFTPFPADRFARVAQPAVPAWS
jgi:glycine oxidase